MGQGEGVDDGFAEVVDDGVEPADVREGDGDFGRGDDFHGDSLFVGG